LDERIWRLIDQAIQIETRAGAISVPELAKYGRCTERAVYNSRKRLRAAGMIEWEPLPGPNATIYRLPWQYAARPSEGVPVNARSGVWIRSMAHARGTLGTVEKA
jgi:hypothetical protein